MRSDISNFRGLSAEESAQIWLAKQICSAIIRMCPGLTKAQQKEAAMCGMMERCPLLRHSRMERIWSYCADFQRLVARNDIMTLTGMAC